MTPESVKSLRDAVEAVMDTAIHLISMRKWEAHLATLDALIAAVQPAPVGEEDELQALLTKEFACYRPTSPAGLMRWAHIALMDNSPHRNKPAPVAPSEDAARLDFMVTREAWIAWSKDGESCRVFHRDEDGESAPIMGWGHKDAWHGSARAAIDSAMKVAG